MVTSDLSASDIIFEQFALGLIALIAFHFPSGNINYKNNTLHSTNILSKKKQILGGPGSVLTTPRTKSIYTVDLAKTI